MHKRGDAGRWFALPRIILLLTALLILGLTLAAGSAVATPATGNISGTVTAPPGGAPVGGIQAQALRLTDEGWWDWAGNASTSSDGTYEIAGLDEGTYRVQFLDATNTYVSQYYGGVTWESAQDLDVAAGATTSDIDASLALGARINGTVTSASGGVPVEGANVTAYAVDRDGSFYYSYGAATLDDGTYSFSGLPEGDYALSFYDYSGEYSSEWYDDAVSSDTAAKVAVAAGETKAGIDATLDAAGHIAGTVTAVSGGAELEDVSVTVFSFNGDYWQSENAASTGADGTYDVGGLRAGTYRIGFRDDNGDYLSEYYDNAFSVDTADDIAVATGSTSDGIDAALLSAGHITGTVTAADSGDPVGDSYVDVWKVLDNGESDYAGYASTDVNGDYDVGGLAAGEYVVQFGDYEGTYLPQYYDNAASEADAMRVTLAEAETRDGIDASLALAGHVAGTVSAASDGAPISDVSVRVFTLTSYGDWDWDRTVSTAEDGTYDIGGLDNGAYRIGFFDSSGAYLSEYFDGADSVDAASDVDVTAGTTTSAIDGTLEAAGHITGKVTAASDGLPVSDGYVSVLRLVDGEWQWQYDLYTADDGTYDIGGLTTGTYRVYFEDQSGRCLSEYYDGVTSEDAATNVDVTAGEITANIDASLAPAGHITGTVTAASGGAKLEGIRVEAESTDASVGYSRGADTAADGTYDLGGLPTGQYKVTFMDDYGIYLTQYFDGADSWAGAANVSVTAGSATPHINATLVEGGRITGKVTSKATGLPISDVGVEAYAWDGTAWNWVADAYTRGNGSGTYEIAGLKAGKYRVKFQNNSAFAFEYFNGANSVDSATDVTVTLGSTTSNINAALVAAGHITGTVTSASDSASVEDEEVSAYQLVNGIWSNEPVAWASTRGDGTYDLGGLPTGTYRVKFAGRSAYSPEFYDGAGSFAAATNVDVTAGSNTTGIDARLEAAAHIKGTVTKSSDGTPLQWVSAIAYQKVGAEWVYVTDFYTAADGTYDIRGLAAGTYRVKFVPDSADLASEYYNDVHAISGATDVVVATSATQNGVDAAIGAGARVSGKVTSPSGTPLSEVTVSVAGEQATTESDGLYRISYVALGSQTITFSKPGYAPQSVDMTVAEGGTTVPDVKLVPVATSGSVEGTVTAAGGGPLSGVTITLSGVPGSITTDVNGRYHISIAPRAYTITFTKSGYVTASRNFAVGQSGTAVQDVALEPYVATSMSTPSVSSRPRHGRSATFKATLYPGAAATAAPSTLYLYHQETKTVKKRIRGKMRRVKVKYWRPRGSKTMSAASSGSLSASIKLKYAGKWRATVRYAGATNYAPVSKTKSFSAR